MTVHGVIAALIPEGWRAAHRRFAETFGYFWGPCPLCRIWFGGHEWRDIDGKPSSVPFPAGEPGSGIAICPSCTRAGKGQRP